MAMTKKHPLARRDTCRRRLISEFLEREPAMLLDELRWKVLREAAKPGHPLEIIGRSECNSFVRTIRKHCPDLQCHQFPINKSTYVGLISRLGVFRVHDVKAVLGFLEGPDPMIFCALKTKVPVDSPRYSERYVKPYHHAVTVHLFERPPVPQAVGSAPYAFVPATTSQKITIVARRGHSVRLETIAAVPWKLFGPGPPSTDDWSPKNALDPLELALVHWTPATRL
jgi:hypothetical protein